MAEKKCNRLYSETTDSRTFRIVHIRFVTSCCLRCAKRERRSFYFISNYEKIASKFPNWKLTSKNKKQWMSKNVKYKEMDGRYYSSEIIW